MIHSLREKIKNLIVSEIVGPDIPNPIKDKDLFQDNGEEIISTKDAPLRKYGAGILFPKQSIYSDLDEESVDSTIDAGEEIIEDVNDIAESDKIKEKKNSSLDNNIADDNDPIIYANALKPSVIALSFKIPRNTDFLTVDVDTAVYKKTNHLCKKCNSKGSKIGGIIFHIDEKRLAQCIDCSGKGLINIKKCPNCNEEGCKSCYYAGYTGDKCNNRDCKQCFYCNGEKEKYYRFPLNKSTSKEFEVEFKIADLANSKTIDKDIFQSDSNNGLKIMLIDRSYSDDNDDLFLTCALMNNNSITKSMKDELCFFQTSFNIRCDFGFIPLKANKNILNDEDQALNDLIYRDRKKYATGHGFSCNWDDGDSVQNIYTESIPSYIIKKFDAQQIDRFKDLDFSFFNLSNEQNFDNSINKLNELSDKYGKWIAEMKNISKTLTSASNKVTASKNINICKKTLDRMKEGVSILKNDDNAKSAFILMNEAMLIQHISAKRKLNKWKYDEYSESNWILSNEFNKIDTSNDDYLDKIIQDKTIDINYKPSWFPFQLSFVLLNIKSITDKSSADRNIVDCLWFPTGGGKTEAYLGLIAFAIFYRRLISRGKDSGVTAVMRYTLRLLTSQQFQRASSLICACEHLRVKSIYKDLLGEDRISIGLWIGGSSSPNMRKYCIANYNTIAGAGRRDRNKDDNELVILKCPSCASQMGVVMDSDSKQSTVIGYKVHRLKIFNNKPNRSSSIAYKCKNQKCDFSEQVLPLVVCDEDIYDIKPTLIISTVDKFASLPWKEDNKVIDLFSQNKISSAPDLIIQDELHLISGPLGSIMGSYETSIKYLFRTNNKFPKIIASTATITRASEQINNLWNHGIEKDDFKKDFTNLFPPQCINYDDTFFGKEIKDDDKGRMYLGLNTSGFSDPKTSQVRIISAMLQAAKDLNCKDSDLDQYWTSLIYFNSIRELGGVSTLIDQDIKSQLKRLQMRKYPGLSYKKHHDKGVYKKWFRSNYFNVRELAARQATNISDEIEALEEYFDSSKEKNYPVDICLSTNMISVGVDISRLNLMLMVGQPKTTSEYIQASSRVGRRDPGIVLTWYNSLRPRDKSHYEHFKGFHQSIYSKVEPTSVTCFSKPVKERTLHAQIFILAKILGHTNPSKIPDVNIIDEIKDIILKRVKVVNPHELDETKDMINETFDRWNNANASEWGRMSGYAIKQTQSNIISLLFPYGKFAQDNDSTVFKTLTSMRNVDSECEAKVYKKTIFY
jgi:hypothetical protein